MEYSIQQIALSLAKKITERALLSEDFSLDHMSSLALEDCKAAARDMIRVLISDMNLAIREDKQSRKEANLSIKEHDRSRDIVTELGRITFARDYYYDKKNKVYISPIDELLSINAYDRVSKGTSAKLVEAATDYSYQHSSDIVTGGLISRQTVRNKILQSPALEVFPNESKKVVSELHVFADEDHVHLQKPNKKKGKLSKEVPLVTVTEGIKSEYKSRNATINPVHFVDENFNTEKLWNSVEAFIRLKYDVSKIERIYVHGDGGNWIASGLNEYPQSKHVMDGYHLGKKLKLLSRKFPNTNVRKRLEDAIKKNDKAKAIAILEALNVYAESSTQKQELKEAKTYFNNKWDELVVRRTLDIPGSCTEGQVSHVLSERFSRNPMGWSKEGLGTLSKLRVYKKNGGRINGSHYSKGKQQCEVLRLAEKVARRDVSGCFDWSIFEGEPLVFDGNSGTQIALQNLGKVRSLVS